MIIDEKLLMQVQAKDLFDGAIVYIKQDNGTFEKCEIDLCWYPTHNLMNQFRAEMKRLSLAGRIFSRRDKAFKDFRDVEHFIKLWQK